MSEDRWHLNKDSEACNCGFHRPARLASASPMLYYRFVFDPQTGNAKTTSSEVVTTFNDMGEESDSKVETGYAYPIEGGWRLTDRAGKPVTDRYIITQVLKSLDQPAESVI